MTLLWKILILCIIFYPCFLSAKKCVKIPPFLHRLRDGVDITRLDLLPIDLGGNDGFRYPILSFSCDFEIRMELNGVSYDIPDQIWSIVNIPSGWLNSNINIFKTTHQIKTSMARNVDVDYKSGLFSASASFEKMQNYMTNTSKYIEEVTSYTSGYKITVMPYWALKVGRLAKMFITRFLSATLDRKTISKYMEFIKLFGTHYFTQGKFGGLLRLTLATDQTYFKGKSDSTVAAQAKASFFEIIKLGGGGSTSTQSIDSRFSKMTTKSTRYFGGRTNLLSQNGGISAWQPTVKDDPWLFGGSLSEISGMFADERKRKCMKRAVQIYMDKAHLKELLRIIQWHFASGKWNRQKNVLKNYQKHIQNVLKNPMPSHEDVRILSRKIENAATIPDWFKKTRLCYSWYPDGDGGQCGGGAGRHLCANINSMTRYYRDDTDRRSGGCQMRWGIFTSNYDNWFRNVKICYKWWPDGDGGQCGGGVSRLLCANVNSFTSFYRDDTDRRSGGCRMTWKLVVPASAPLWAQNIKLCYQWYPDGNGGQCGGGAARMLCAFANSYTGVYRDDTDRRGGGCQMRWGMFLR